MPSITDFLKNLKNSLGEEEPNFSDTQSSQQLDDSSVPSLSGLGDDSPLIQIASVLEDKSPDVVTDATRVPVSTSPSPKSIDDPDAKSYLEELVSSSPLAKGAVQAKWKRKYEGSGKPLPKWLTPISGGTDLTKLISSKETFWDPVAGKWNTRTTAK